MFGIGFTEILLISIIAILFLGPDKLPETMVQIAKFIKSVKKTVGEAKGALEEELKISDLKEEALSYKQQLDSATSELRSFKNIDIDDIINDEPKETKSATKATPSSSTEDQVETVEVEQKNETVTFKKKSSKKKEPKKETKEESSTESTQVFKTDIDEKEGNA
jgi:sec-independent protein translocase protein TatB